MSPLLLRRLTDEKLGTRLASGDAAAFDELYRRYANRLAAYGGHLLGDAAAGDDVAQVALLNAYQAVRGGRVPDSMRAWLYRIAHNAALDLLARRRELLRPEVLGRAAESPDDAGEIRGALLAALAGLPERQRRAWVLREVNGLRVAEIAAELSLAVPQVEQALFAARNRLAEHLLFGERLSCEAVTRLGEGVLGAHERRAIKSHLRGCSACRAAVGPRVSGVARFLPLPSLEWLRDAAVGLVGGGAPAAVKVGAVVATATVAAGVPLSGGHNVRPQRAAAPPVVARLSLPSPRVPQPTASARREVVSRVRPAPRAEQHRPASVVRTRRRGEHRGPTRAPATDDGSRVADQEHQGAGSGGGPGPSVAAVPPSPVQDSRGPSESSGPSGSSEGGSSGPGSSGTGGGEGTSGSGGGKDAADPDAD